MKIYNITLGQLVVLWIMGVIGIVFSFVIAGNPLVGAFYNGLALFGLVMIPLILIFYTIGWHAEWESDVWQYMAHMRRKYRHYRKYEDEEDGSKFKEEDK